ncbi:MAG: YecR family lipoprotein [Immundisolibacterales bacterium]|nr:YecR family lipoprotein [Immundisolibacterales bacterium]
MLKPIRRQVVATAAILGAAMVAGCHLDKVAPSEIGGSAEDAAVTLAATIGRNERVDWKRAAPLAAERCQSWGYGRAQPISEGEVRCADNPGSTCGWRGSEFRCDCSTLTVAVTYRCIW